MKESNFGIITMKKTGVLPHDRNKDTTDQHQMVKHNIGYHCDITVIWHSKSFKIIGIGDIWSKLPTE